MLFTSQLLPLSKIELNEWQLIKITGLDSIKFLQGQLTANVASLNDNHFLFASHCDPKGKVWSNMLIFKRGDDIYYIERKSVASTQVNELKKYAVFSKVTIDIDNDLKIIGLASKDLNQLTQINKQFNDEQNCITLNNLTYLKIDFPTTRYLVIGASNDIDNISLSDDCLRQPDEQWSLLDMQANYPIIDFPVTNQYLPQAFNLQNFDAISFDKGCYCGQEMVARAQYRGINKRALYLLVGQSDQLPNIGDTLEQKIAENWRETGCVLAALKIDDSTIWIQAILNNDLESDTQFRVKNSLNSHLLIKSE